MEAPKDVTADESKGTFNDKDDVPKMTDAELAESWKASIRKVAQANDISESMLAGWLKSADACSKK